MIRTMAAALFAAAPLAAQNFDTVTVRSQKVADGIYMLVGSGGNIGVATGSDATYIIDSQYAPLTPKILAAIGALTRDPVKFLINTHWHGDHVGGNENLGKAGTLVFAHDNVRVRMSKEQFVERLQERVPASPKAALPVVTFSDTMSFHLNGETVIVFHVKKAHTDGDAIVYFRNVNVVHAGDVYVRYGYPFIDGSSGGTFLGMIAAAQDLLAVTNAATKYIPGHGALAERKDVETYLAMLRTVRDRVLAQVRAKKSLEQVKAANPLADLDAQYGKGFVTAPAFLELVYKELASKP